MSARLRLAPLVAVTLALVAVPAASQHGHPTGPPGMIHVKGGRFELGISTDQIKQISEDNFESVERNYLLFLGSQVETKEVPAFWIDRNEVTHLMYWHFCRSTGRTPPVFKAAVDEKTKNPVFKPIWPSGRIPAGWEHRPVTFVTYEDAVAYCEWTGCRLPTEDEWEVAARSGRGGFDGRFWPWGSQYLPHRANDAEAHDLEARKSLKPPEGVNLPPVLEPGSLPAGTSPLGINDLAGNAAEWTSSPFLPRRSFAEGPGVSFQDFDNRQRVVRGGGTRQRRALVSTVARAHLYPLMRHREIGFRRARSARAGLDRITRLRQSNRMAVRLQEFEKLKEDSDAHREFPAIDARQERWAVLESFDRNEKLDVPDRARSILIASRVMTRTRGLKDLQRLSKGDHDVEDSCLIGILDTDVALTNPPLTPGLWFVAFKADHLARNEKGRRVHVGDAFWFVPESKGREPVRLKARGDEAIPARKPVDTSLKIVAGGVDAVFGFATRSGKGFQVVLKLEADAARLAGFD